MAIAAAAAAFCAGALAQQNPYAWPPPADRLTLPIWHWPGLAETWLHIIKVLPGK